MKIQIFTFLQVLMLSKVQALFEGWWSVHSYKDELLKNYSASLSVSPQEQLCDRGENVTLHYTVSGSVNSCVTLNVVSSPRTIANIYPNSTAKICPEYQENFTEIVVATFHEGLVTLTVEPEVPGIIYTGDAFVDLSVRIKSSIDTAGNVFGWIYTVAWDISFLPQIYHNWRRQSVVGLSFDFLTLNLIGFSCYSLFNIGLYWIPAIQDEYKIRHPTSILHVRLNDVIFPLYAVLCTIIQISQCFIYERGAQRVSTTCRLISAGLLLAAVIEIIIVGVMPDVWWLDFLYFLSYIKLAITCIKYFPQLYENYKRKSTEGWSIYQVILDFTGGSLSLIQMFMLGYNYDDIKSVLTDPTKLGLGLLSVFFNIFFFLQHYVIYRNMSIAPEESGEQMKAKNLSITTITSIIDEQKEKN